MRMGTTFFVMMVLAAGSAAAQSQSALLQQRVGQSVAQYALDHGAPQTSFGIGGGNWAFQWQFMVMVPLFWRPPDWPLLVPVPGYIQCMVTLIASPATRNADTKDLGPWIVREAQASSTCPP